MDSNYGQQVIGSRTGQRGCGPKYGGASGTGRAILARRRRAVVHARIGIVQHRLAAAHPARKIRQHFQIMAARRKPLAHAGRHPILDHHVAAAKGQLGEARSFQRRLDVHVVVHQVRNELRVRLRLVVAAHDAEADVDVVLLHEGRDDGVQRPFARRKRVGMRRIQFEQRAAILQVEPVFVHHYARSEAQVHALDQRRDVAVAIDHREINRVARRRRRLARRRRAVGLVAIDQRGALARVALWKSARRWAPSRSAGRRRSGADPRTPASALRS